MKIFLPGEIISFTPSVGNPTKPKYVALYCDNGKVKVVTEDTAFCVLDPDEKTGKILGFQACSSKGQVVKGSVSLSNTEMVRVTCYVQSTEELFFGQVTRKALLRCQGLSDVLENV